MTDAGQKESILIIDDTPANLAVLVNFLTDSGFNVFVAEDGESGMEQVDFANPDIVLLDIMMPGIDGMETCRRLKNQEKTKDIPVIFMTALSDIEDIVKGFTVGAVDYVTKPIMQEEVLARIKTHLAMRRLQRDLIAKNAELHVKNEQLHSLNQTKNEFLGIAAHDLRNPLGSLIGYLDLMLHEIRADKYSMDRVTEDLQVMLKVSDRMKNLVNKLLDISAIESGKLELDLKLEDLSQITAESEELFKRKAVQKKINLSVRLVNTLPQVYVDRSRITEVFDNLISNAIKFNKADGSIEIYSERKDSEVITHVRDTGLGLDENDLKDVFKTFTKLSAKPTAGESSTGLGLAIVKKIVELHGGRVWVESRKDIGSTFSFSLPVP